MQVRTSASLAYNKNVEQMQDSRMIVLQDYGEIQS